MGDSARKRQATLAMRRRPVRVQRHCRDAHPGEESGRGDGVPPEKELARLSRLQKRSDGFHAQVPSLRQTIFSTGKCLCAFSYDGDAASSTNYRFAKQARRICDLERSSRAVYGCDLDELNSARKTDTDPSKSG